MAKITKSTTKKKAVKKGAAKKSASKKTVKAVKKKAVKKSAAKKTTSKRPAVKKTVTKKTASKKSSSVKKEAMKKKPIPKSIQSAIKKLNDLLPELDETEIGFLIQQAGVIIHNKRITSNPEKRELRESKFNERMEQWKADKADMMSQVSVEEGDEGKHFILVMGNYRNFFDRGEFKRIVKLCHAASDADDAARRLFTWLDRFRSDVLKNSAIDRYSDPCLGKVYEEIISRYTTK